MINMLVEQFKSGDRALGRCRVRRQCRISARPCRKIALVPVWPRPKLGSGRCPVISSSR